MGFLSSFMGKDQKNDLLQGTMDYAAAINKGQAQHQAQTKEYTEKGMGLLNPYMGGEGRDMYLASQGVQGPEAEQGFYDNLQMSPGYAAREQRGADVLEAAGAGRGQTYSGGQMKSLFDFGMKNFGDFEQQRINNLRHIYDQGLGAAGQGVGLLAGAGKEMADTSFGVGQLLGNNAMGFANASAALRDAPLNNILAVGNTAANMIGAFTGGGGNPVDTGPSDLGPWATDTQFAQQPAIGSAAWQYPKGYA